MIPDKPPLAVLTFVLTGASSVVALCLILLTSAELFAGHSRNAAIYGFWALFQGGLVGYLWLLCRRCSDVTIMMVNSSPEDPPPVESTPPEKPRT